LRGASWGAPCVEGRGKILAHQRKEENGGGVCCCDGSFDEEDVLKGADVFKYSHSLYIPCHGGSLEKY